MTEHTDLQTVTVSVRPFAVCAHPRSFSPPHCAFHRSVASSLHHTHFKCKRVSSFIYLYNCFGRWQASCVHNYYVYACGPLPLPSTNAMTHSFFLSFFIFRFPLQTDNRIGRREPRKENRIKIKTVTQYLVVHGRCFCAVCVYVFRNGLTMGVNTNFKWIELSVVQRRFCLLSVVQRGQKSLSCDSMKMSADDDRIKHMPKTLNDYQINLH